MNSLLRPFERNRRFIVLSWQDHLLAGEVLARLKWPASPKFSDVLIAVSARKIGAEVWTLNTDDFRLLGSQLGITVVNPE